MEGCPCCTCRYGRGREGCGACWTRNDVQTWIDGWAKRWNDVQPESHGARRFLCPPSGWAPACPGWKEKLFRKSVKQLKLILDVQT